MTINCYRSGFLIAIIFFWMLGSLGCVDSQRTKIPRSDRIYSESSVAARAAFAQDRIEEAISFYALALKRARAMDQPEAIGNAAYNLAACNLRLKKYHRARVLLAEARHEFLNHDFPLADVLVLQARAAYLDGDIKAANIFIDQIKTGHRLNPLVEHRAQAFLLEGQMACDQHDWSAAADRLNQAQSNLKLNQDPLLHSQLASLAGRIALGKGDLKAAANAFERQADLFGHASQYRALSPVLAQAGKVYSVLKEHDLAADRFYRAARIAAAWGDMAFAGELVKEALNAADKAEDSTIVRLAESLLLEITNDQ